MSFDPEDEGTTLLITVPYYRIPRDEDGRPNRLFDRDFEMALRWHGSDLPVPEDMIGSASRKAMKHGEAPVHAGAVALHNLRDGQDISQRQLDAAIAYLHTTIAFYASSPWEGTEPYPGRNDDAVRDNLNLLRLIIEANDPGAVDTTIGRVEA